MNKIIRIFLLAGCLGLVFTPVVHATWWDSIKNTVSGSIDSVVSGVTAALNKAGTAISWVGAQVKDGLRGVYTYFAGESWNYNDNFPSWSIIPSLVAEDSPMKIMIDINADEGCYVHDGSVESGGNKLNCSLYTAYKLYRTKDASALQSDWSVIYPGASSKTSLTSDNWKNKVEETMNTYHDIEKMMKDNVIDTPPSSTGSGNAQDLKNDEDTNPPAKPASDKEALKLLSKSVKDGYFVYDANFYLMKKKEEWIGTDFNYKTHKGKQVKFLDILKLAPSIETTDENGNSTTDSDATIDTNSPDGGEKDVEQSSDKNEMQMYKDGSGIHHVKLLWMDDVPMIMEPFRHEFGEATKPLLVGYVGGISFVADTSWYNPAGWVGLLDSGDTRNAHFPIIYIEDTTPPMTYRQGPDDSNPEASAKKVQDEKDFAPFAWSIDGLLTTDGGAKPSDEDIARWAPAAYDMKNPADGSSNSVDIVKIINETKATNSVADGSTTANVAADGTYTNTGTTNLYNWAGKVSTHGSNAAYMNSAGSSNLLTDHGYGLEMTSADASSAADAQGKIVVGWDNVWDNMMYPYNGGQPSITKFGLVVEPHWNPNFSAYGNEKMMKNEAMSKELAAEAGMSEADVSKGMTINGYVTGGASEYFNTTELDTWEKVVEGGHFKRDPNDGYRPILKKSAPRQWIDCTSEVTEKSKESNKEIKNNGHNIKLQIPHDRTGLLVLYWYAEDGAWPTANVWTSDRKVILIEDDIPPMISVSLANLRDLRNPLSVRKTLFPWYSVHSGSISNPDAGMIHDTASPHEYSVLIEGGGHDSHRRTDDASDGEPLKIDVLRQGADGASEAGITMVPPIFDGDPDKSHDNSYFVGRQNEPIQVCYKYYENCSLPRVGGAGSLIREVMTFTVAPIDGQGVANSFGFRFPIWSSDYVKGLGPSSIVKVCAGIKDKQNLNRDAVASALSSEGGDMVVQGDYILSKSGYFNSTTIRSNGILKGTSDTSHPMELIFTKSGLYKMVVTSSDGVDPEDDKNNKSEFQIYFYIQPTTVQVVNMDEKITDTVAKKNE